MSSKARSPKKKTYMKKKKKTKKICSRVNVPWTQRYLNQMDLDLVLEEKESPLTHETGQVYSHPRLAGMMRSKDESSNMELMEAPSSVFTSSQN